jgi:intracellular sulfur oxidation DsrE/DsrF family protein
MLYQITLHVKSCDTYRLGIAIEQVERLYQKVSKGSISVIFLFTFEGIDLFYKHKIPEELLRRMENLATYGVKFKLVLPDDGEVKLDEYPFLDIIEAGLIELVKLYRAGYLYISI